MSTLFISHSSQDNEESKKLEAWLEEHGYGSVFLDLDPEKGIQAGASWERTLYTKLRACRAVVALCSSSYLASHWCFAEIALARMEGKELFALQIDPWGEDTNLPSILTERQFIDLRIDAERGFERLLLGMKALGIVPEEHRDWTPGRPPFPGLRAFDEKDAPIFFGRDAEVLEGVELLNSVRRQGHPHLVMILGSSGSGKSSLARAGILPRLRGDPDRWLVVGPLRPGKQPALELAAAFAKAFEEAGKPRSRAEILDRLGEAALGSFSTGEAESPGEGAAGEQLSAREMLREALARMEGELTADDSQVAASVERLKEYLSSDAPSPVRARAVGADANPLAALASELRLDSGFTEAKVVLVIDQLEELLGHEDAGDDHPANRFLRVLKGGIEAEDNSPLALGTMRSDFLGMLQRSDPLRGVGFKSLSVGPMSDEGMLEVIEAPATLGGIDLEKPELTQRLLKETGTADALPLLAFTLRAMWDRYHESLRFDVQGYEALGGLQGAIAQVADDTMEAALAKSEGGTKKDLRVAFLSLARPAAEGTGWARQPASWDEMPERVRPMIQQFIDQRLLVKRADGTVEVAHEALFRSWKTLRGWLNANAEGLLLLREIRVDAEKWEKAESEAEKEPYLWRAGRLARALELRGRGVLRLTELDTSFIEASSKRSRRRTQIKRLMVVALAVLAGVAAISALLADRAREIALQRRDQAEDLISFMIVDLRKKLQPIGKLDILDAVGAKAMDYFAVLGDDVSGEDALARVRALRQIGEVRFDQGQLEPALEAFSQSRDYAQALHEAEPSTNEYLFEVGQAEFWVGYVALKQGELDAAKRSFTRYMERSRDLLSRDQANSDYQLELMYAHRNLGSLAIRSEAEAALAHFDKMMPLNQQLVAASPDSLSLQFELAESHSWMGSALLQSHRLADAEASFQHAFDLLETLIERDGRPRYKEELADLAQFLADIHLHQGDTASGEQMLQLSLSINNALVLHDPENAEWRKDQLWTRYRLAQLHYGTSTVAERKAGIQRLMSELAAMHQDDESDLRIVENLSLSERLLALAQLESGDVRQALVTIERAWSRVESLLSGPAAGNRTLPRHAALIAVTRGRLHEATGDRDLAQRIRQATLAMLEDEASLGLVELAIRRQVHAQLGETAAARRIKAVLEEAGFADPRYFPSR